MLAEYDEEQAALEASMTEWQKMIDNWNADRVRMAEFIEKIVVHEGEGRGKQRRQQEEQAEKENRSQVLAQARYERYKQERREFTARKRAGLLTPEGQAEEERRLERNRAYQKKQRDKKKATQPEKPRKRSLEELAKLDRAGADLTPEEVHGLPPTSRGKRRR